MTLSLDDVRNKRFRLARKSGYEVAEVDDFLDQVQEAFAQLVEENENLKHQVEAVGADGAPAAEVGATGGSSGSPVPAPREPEQVVVTTSAEASAAVVRLVQLSTEQAERLVSEAKAESERIQAEAAEAADRLGTDSRVEAERIQAEAREQAEALQADALARAEQLENELRERREQMFGDLDSERGSLSAAIEDLRRFEETFRANLTAHLRSHLEVLDSGRAEPADAPPLVPAAGLDPAVATADATDQPSGGGTDAPTASTAEGRSDTVTPGAETPAAEDTGEHQPSETPHLDALLGDQR